MRMNEDYSQEVTATIETWKQEAEVNSQSEAKSA
jgi:hypothetical protein